jgi:two-component system, OmpR family, response regulator
LSQPKHVLVVDDNDDVRNVMIEMLQDRDYRVTAVADGASMRDFLKIDDGVDCVVLDVLLPGEDGVSLALQLKQSGVPVVIISGGLDAVECAEQNNLRLLQKPFNAHQLYDAVNAVLRQI